MRSWLRGVKFNSDTDTEVIVHIVERYLSQDTTLAEATRKALTHLKGAHGIVLMSAREPDKIVAARIGNAGGVVIGLGETETNHSMDKANGLHPKQPTEMFVASDLPAILEHTRQVIFLNLAR